MTRERRSRPREILGEELGFIQINRDEGGRIRNVSETGLCFETFTPIERERLVRFWFSLNLRDRIEASGKLAWLDGDKRIGGLRFLDLSPKGQRHLREHLKRTSIEEPQRKASEYFGELTKRSWEDHAAKPQAEAPKQKGSAFLAAVAKQSWAEVAAKPQAEAPTAKTSPFLATLAKQPRGNGAAEPQVEPPTAKASPFLATLAKQPQGNGAAEAQVEPPTAEVSPFLATLAKQPPRDVAAKSQAEAEKASAFLAAMAKESHGEVGAKLQTDAPAANSRAFVSVLPKESSIEVAAQPHVEAPPAKARAFPSAMTKEPRGDVAARPQAETPTTKAAASLAELAKRSWGQVAAKPQLVNSTLFPQDARGTTDSVKAVTPGTTGASETEAALEASAVRAGAEPADRNVTGMVPLERYRTTKRRQFVRGIFLGALGALAITIFSARYFGGKPAGSGAAPSATPTRARTAPVTPVSDAALEGAPASQGPAADRGPAGPLYSPDRPAPHSVYVPSASGSEMSGVAQRTGVESREGDAKSSKKSSATPQQLWADLQRGNMKAAVPLAERYLQGDGVPMNCDQARILLLVASEKNNADAIRRLHELDKTGCPTAPGASAPKTQKPTEPKKP